MSMSMPIMWRIMQENRHSSHWPDAPRGSRVRAESRNAGKTGTQERN
jgi:hypothetical protein